jgi:hypothetical protein
MFSGILRKVLDLGVAASDPGSKLSSTMAFSLALILGSGQPLLRAVLTLKIYLIFCLTCVTLVTSTNNSTASVMEGGRPSAGLHRRRRFRDPMNATASLHNRDPGRAGEPLPRAGCG